MSTADLAPTIRQRFFDSEGKPLAGGQLYSYQAGTTTPLETFTDFSGDTPNTNPIVLDADGYADVWLGNHNYKFILADSSDNILWIVDNVKSIQQQINTGEIEITGALAASNNLSDVDNKTASFNNISPMSAIGDLIYGAATGQGTRLSGNITTTKKFLTETGDGSHAAAPIWSTIQVSDVPVLNQDTTGTASNVTGTIAIGNGGTGQTTAIAALNALLPSQTGNAGKVLETDGTTVSWQDGGTSGVVPIVEGGTGETTANDALNALLPSQAGNAAKILTTDGTNTSWQDAGSGSGSVTSVGVSDTSTSPIYSVTNSPITSSGTIDLTLVNQSANKVFAGPSTGSPAQPTFRSIVPTDIPTLNQNTTGTAANVTGVVAIVNGGTGQTSQGAAVNALLPSQSGNNTKFLQTDGTNVSWQTASGGGGTGDVVGPASATDSDFALFDGTTGKLIKDSGFSTVPVAKGGTGQTSLNAHAVILGNGTSAVSSTSPITPNYPLVSNGPSSDPSFQVLPIAGGGTGQITASGAFNALSPLTTKGDLHTYGPSNTRLPVGADGKALVADSNQTTGLRWANVGPKNLITYPDFENGTTTGWSLGTTGTLTNGIPTGTPTFGSYSGNLNLSATTTNPISGTYSLNNTVSTGSGSVAAGDMFATDALPVDADYRAALLSYSLEFQTNGNPLNLSGTSANSYGVACWDVTNSVWLPVSNPFGFKVSTIVGTCAGTFQTLANTASIRFIVYSPAGIIAVAGKAILINFDNFSVGPSPVNQTIGPIAARYFLTANQAITTGDTQLTGFTKSFDTAGLLVGNAFVAPIAGEYQLNAQISESSVSVTNICGYKINGGSTVYVGALAVSRSGGSDFLNLNANDQVTFIANCNGSTTIQAGATNSFWSISLVQSAGVGPAGQVVSSKLSTLASASITANTAITFTTNEFDSTGSLSNFNKYTCPTSGPYLVTLASTITTSGSSTSYVAKNGSFSLTASNILSAPTASAGGTGSTIIQCNAGDTLQIAFTSSVTLVSTNTNATFSLFQGPSAQTAAPSITVSANNTSAQSLANNTPTTITGWTKLKDSQNIFNASTGVATIQTSGSYRATFQAGLQPTTANTGEMQASIVQAGSATTTITSSQPLGNTASVSAPLASFTFLCIAGDTLTFRALQSNGGSVSLLNNAAFNYLSIERTGN